MLSTFRPSTMSSGPMLPELEEKPRTRMDAEAPGAPELLMMWIPAALPWRAAAASDVDLFWKSSSRMEETEPVRSLFFWTP